MQENAQKISTIKRNILYFLEYKGVSRYDFYKKSGITRGVLNHPGGISEDNITKFLAYFPEVNIEWLISGTGKMLKAASEVNDIEVTYKKKSDLSGSVVDGIPYFDLPVSAGDIQALLVDAKPISYINLPQLAGCTAVLPVYGNSMKGVVEPGDLIAIHEIHSRDEFDPAMPYLVITDEHRMIKYLHADENDPTVIWAESTNLARIRLSVESIKMVYAIKCVIRFF